MYTYQSQTLNGERVTHYSVLREETPLTYHQVLTAWESDASFRDFFCKLLADSPFRAYRWETPPINLESLDRTFEFVLLRADALDRPVDANAFREHFTEEAAVSFQNLSGDATLVVPSPQTSIDAYGHLAAFQRLAPDEQLHSLWQLVAKSTMARVGKTPIWLSTAGMGVAWLHVRIDARPKYYGHRPYRDDPTLG